MLDKKCMFCENNFIVGDRYGQYGEDYSHTKCLDEQMFTYRHNLYTALISLKNRLNSLTLTEISKK